MYQDRLRLLRTYKKVKYRVSQTFVRLVSCSITFDQNFIIFLHEISRRCLLLYRVHVFRISLTSFPPLFFVTFSSARLQAHMIYFELIYHLVGRSYFSTSTSPNNIFFLVQAAEKKKYFKHSSKNQKIMIPAPIHSNAFVPLYKYETSCVKCLFRP